MTIISKTIGLSNVHAIKGDKTIIVDTGTYCDEAGMLYELQQMGIEPTEVSLIILTHGHFDHCANIGELKKITGAPVLAHEDAVNFLQTGQFDMYIQRGEYGNQFWNMVKDFPMDLPAPTTPDIIIGDEEFDLNPYGVNAKVVHTPGHVSSNLTVITADREAICGDTIVIDINTGRGHPAAFCDDEEALQASLKRLQEEADIYYSGHGGPFKKEEVDFDK